MTHRGGAAVAALIAVALLLAGCSGSAGAAPSSPSVEATPTPEVSATAIASPTTAPPPAVPTATATPAPIATPEPPPTVEVAVPMSDLEAALNEIAAAYTAPGEYAFAVTDLQTGETVGVNLERPHYTGCTVNLLVLVRATLDVQAGLLEEEVVGDLISETIRTSNAVTAHELYRIVGDGDVVAGVERVAALAEVLAPGGVILDHPPLYRHESRGVDPNNWVTASAMNEALAAIHNHGLLTEEWLDYLLEKMTGVKPGLNYLLATGPQVPVSHKNGFFPADDGKSWVDNDVGIVRFEQDDEERAYAVSFFSQRVPTKYGDVALGQRLSLATWEFFLERYPSTEIEPAGGGAVDGGAGS
jgi:hypothetical protein